MRQLAAEVDLLLVVGARNSSNSNRLREIGSQMGVPSYLIDDAKGLDPSWIEGIRTVGLTAGASAPEELVDEVIKRLGALGAITFEELAGVEERVQFKLPPQLTEADPNDRKRA